MRVAIVTVSLAEAPSDQTPVALRDTCRQGASGSNARATNHTGAQ